MSTATEITSTKRLSPDMTLGEVLLVAMKFEKTAYRFYSDLVKRVGRQIQPVAHDLAAEEKKHYALLERLSNDRHLARQLQLRLRAKELPTASTFSNFVALPTLPDQPIEADLLEYAGSRERIACEHYGYLAEVTPASPLRDLFEFLRDEERQHLQLVQSREAEMFSVF